MSLARRPATKAGYDVSGSFNLYRRDSGIYWVRLYVPRYLQVAAGKREVHRSTGCRDQRLAKIVAAELVRHWHQSVSALKSMDLSKVQAGSLDLVGDGHLTLDEAATGFGTTALDLFQRFLSSQRYGVFVLAKAWRGWVVCDAAELSYERHDVTGEITAVELDEAALGKSELFSGELRVRFLQDIVPLLDDTVSTLDVDCFWHGGLGTGAFLVDGDGAALTRADLLLHRRDVVAIRQRVLDQLPSAVVAPAVSLVPLGNVGPASQVQKLKRFSVLRDQYFDATKHGVKPDHLRRKEASAQMFVELADDPEVAVVRPLDVREFAKRIAELPAHRDRRMREFGLQQADYAMLISLKNKHSWPALSVREQEKILNHVREIFDWAMTEGDIEKNYAKGVGAHGGNARISARRKVKDHEQRDALTSEHLEMIFSTSWFRTGRGDLTPEGKYYSFRPYYYWLPLLALYCGGRLNELSQLFLKDIFIDDSIASIDFNLEGDGKIDADGGSSGGKSLKTVNSARRVPIPEMILGLGFLEYVEALKLAGHERLFPELSFDAVKGYGKQAGSWFNERFLGKKLGIPRDGRSTFHSMRHNFATALGEAGTSSNDKADLMGHSREGTMSDTRYDKGNFARLKQAIDSVQHAHPPITGFDVKQGALAVKHALDLKKSRRGKGL